MSVPAHRPLLFAAAATLIALAAPVDATAQRVGCLWDRHADSPIERFEAGTLPIDGELYCFGGFFNQAIQAAVRVDAYDPLTDAWSRKADMPSPTTHVAFAREGRNVWLLGGFIGDNPGVATDEVWVYDVDLDSFTAGPSMPRPIAAGAAAVIGRDLHYYGGCEADRNTMTGDHWVLDLDAPGLGWQPLASMPEPRCHHSGAVLGGEVWAVGGQLGHDSNPQDTRWVHAYDPGTDSWRQGPLLPEARSHFEPGTFVENGNLYIAAGKDLTTGRDILADMLELDPVLGVWSYLPPLPNPRYGAGVQLLNGRIYAANGAARFNAPQPDLYSRDWNATFPNPLLINCGGPEVVAASGSCCWCGDIGFQTGSVASFNPNADVQNTDDDAVFDKQRQQTPGQSAPIRYRLPMGDGFYRVSFHLAERGTQTPGVRVLSLLIEDVTLADGLDLALDPGFEVALVEGFDVEVTDGALDIEVASLPGQRAMVAALEIERLGPDHFASECSNPVNSTGDSSSMGFVGTTSVGRDDLTITAGPVPSGQFGLFIQGELAGNIPIPGGGGDVCISFPVYRLPIVQSQGGLMSYQLQLQNTVPGIAPITGGTTWRFQAWHRDIAGPGFGLSNALKLVFTP